MLCERLSRTYCVASPVPVPNFPGVRPRPPECLGPGMTPHVASRCFAVRYLRRLRIWHAMHAVQGRCGGRGGPLQHCRPAVPAWTRPTRHARLAHACCRHTLGTYQRKRLVAALRSIPTHVLNGTLDAYPERVGPPVLHLQRPTLHLHNQNARIIHTCMHAYIQTHIHTYMHTCMHRHHDRTAAHGAALDEYESSGKQRQAAATQRGIELCCGPPNHPHGISCPDAGEWSSNRLSR